MKETSRGVPVIMSVDDDSHWILALRVGKNRAQIFDPDDKFPTRIGKGKLLERWSFFEDRRQKPRLHILQIIPFKEKSIKAVITRERLLKTVDVS